MQKYNPSNLESRSRRVLLPELVLFDGHGGPIISLVQQYFGVDFFVSGKSRKLAFPRQVACHLLSVFTNLNSTEIAELVGYSSEKKHCNNCNSLKVIASLCKYDDNIRKQVIELETQIECLGQ